MTTDRLTSSEFVRAMTDEYREKMAADVDEYYSKDYFDRLGGPQAVIETEFPHTAWRELFIGCLPAVRELDLIYRHGDPYYRDRDLVAGVLKQIRDEVKHARVFSNVAERFGVDSDLVTWESHHYDELVRQCRASVEHDKPQYNAVAFQCSTEIMAAFMIRNMADYIETEYPDVAVSLRDITADEGDHVHIGRLVVKRFAEPEDYDRMEEIARNKYSTAVDVLKAL